MFVLYSEFSNSLERQWLKTHIKLKLFLVLVGVFCSLLLQGFSLLHQKSELIKVKIYGARLHTWDMVCMSGVCGVIRGIVQVGVMRDVQAGRKSE